MLIPISEKLHYKRLKEKSIVIEDHFFRNDTSNDTWVRATDGLRCDNVVCRRRKEKRYFLNNKCIYVEKNFMKNTEYTFVSGNSEKEIVTCPSCGHSGDSKVFFDGCPFCGTNFNVDFKKKNISLPNIKEMLFGKVVKLCVLFIIVIFYCAFFIISGFDILNIITGIALFPFLLIFSYLLIAVGSIPYLLVSYFIETIINRLIGDKIYAIQSRVYSDLNTELNMYYYDINRAPQYKDMIDFDIINFKRFELIGAKAKDTYAHIRFKIRKLFFIDGEIKSHYEILEAHLKKNKIIADKSELAFIKCENCGASIDLLAGECEYCSTPNIHRTEWIITNINEL